MRLQPARPARTPSCSRQGMFPLTDSFPSPTTLVLVPRVQDLPLGLQKAASQPDCVLLEDGCHPLLSLLSSSSAAEILPLPGSRHAALLHGFPEALPLPPPTPRPPASCPVLLCGGSPCAAPVRGSHPGRWERAAGSQRDRARSTRWRRLSKSSPALPKVLANGAKPIPLKRGAI